MEVLAQHERDVLCAGAGPRAERTLGSRGGQHAGRQLSSGLPWRVLTWSPHGPFRASCGICLLFPLLFWEQHFLRHSSQIPACPRTLAQPGLSHSSQANSYTEGCFNADVVCTPPPQDGAVTPTQGAAGDWASPTTHSGTPCNCLSVGEAPASSLPTALHQDGAWSSAAASWQPPRESGGKVKIQLVTGTLPLLCGCVRVLSKRRVSGERPVLAVAPGPVRESGVGSQLHQWTSPGNLLPSLPGREVSLCQRGVG